MHELSENIADSPIPRHARGDDAMIGRINPLMAAMVAATQWWIGLSTAICFGLGFSTVLTLLVTPCALMVRGNVSAWWRRRRAARTAAAEAHHPEPRG